MRQERERTIFIPIANRQQARNVLRTRIFETIKEAPNVRLVFFAPFSKLSAYQKECGGRRIVWEGVGELPHFFSLLDSLFGKLALFYINSSTGRALRKKWLLLERKDPFRYVVSMLFLFLFGSHRWLRTTIRFLDYHLVRDDRYADFFEKYKPDLVFSPRVDATLDRSFLRQAKRRKITTVGMISSWDNITYSKYPFRILPDSLVVYNDLIKQEAIRYLDMSAGRTVTTGMPHFDHYVSTERSSREEFCKKMHIDPMRRILLFASIGSFLNPTEWQVLRQLDRALTDAKLPRDLIIIFRQHPTEKTIIDPSLYSERIVFDDSKTVIQDRGQTYSEILDSDMRHLADSIYHAAVTLNTASTMSIDASVFDKPIINIGFDGWEQRPFHQSVRRFYAPSHVHYQPLVKSGGVRIAYSLEELLGFINLYLKNPRLDSEGRQRIVREQCYKLDGLSGKRIGEYLLK